MEEQPMKQNVEPRDDSPKPWRLVTWPHPLGVTSQGHYQDLRLAHPSGDETLELGFDIWLSTDTDPDTGETFPVVCVCVEDSNEVLVADVDIRLPTPEAVKSLHDEEEQERLWLAAEQREREAHGR